MKFIFLNCQVIYLPDLNNKLLDTGFLDTDYVMRFLAYLYHAYHTGWLRTLLRVISLLLAVMLFLVESFDTLLLKRCSDNYNLNRHR